MIENYINYRLGGRAERVFRDPNNRQLSSLSEATRKWITFSQGVTTTLSSSPLTFRAHLPVLLTDSGKTVAGGPPETVGAAHSTCSLRRPSNEKKS